jgi:zinc protease
LDEVRLETLPNGLVLVQNVMRVAPAAAFVMAFRAGSLWEREGTRGMSHFCEHMMFKGSRGIPASRFWQKVQRNGAIANAFTSRDMTAYFTSVPSCRLAEILEIDADRMFDPLFDPGEVDAERSVVLQERRSSCVDNAAGALDELLFHTAFREHPYRHPITGYEEDISAFGTEGVRSYHRQFYSPSNAVLVAAGDINISEMRRQVEALFGRDSLPHVRQSVPPEVLTRLVEAEMRHESDLPRLSIAFSCPPGNVDDSVRLELLAIYLAGTRSSILEQALVQKEIALDVSASAMSGVAPGLFAVRTTLYPGIDSERAEAIILSSMARLSKDSLSDEVMDDLRTQFLAFKTLSAAGPVGRAAETSMGMLLFGDPDYVAHTSAAARSASAEDLVEAARRWLDPSRMAVARLIPAGAGASPSISMPAAMPGGTGDVPVPASIDYAGLEVPRELLTASVMSMSDGMEESLLDNGLRVILKLDRTFPVAALGFVAPLGSFREPESLAGLASVTAETMLYGTPGQGYRDFNYRLERKGSEIAFSAGPEFSSGSIFVLRDDLPEAIAVAADLLCSPAFREEDVRRVVEEKVTEVLQKRESPFGLALDSLAILMASDPRSARVPTEETLRAIGAAEARDLHARCCRPDGAVVSIVGDFDRERALYFIRSAFGGWRRPECALPEIARLDLAPEGARSFLAMEGKAQTAVVIGTAAPPRGSAEFESFRLLNTILGDGIGSRMGQVIREKLGMSYSAGSEYMPGPGWGRLLAYLATSGDKEQKGLDVVLRIMEELASKETAEVELELAKASHTGRHAMMMTDMETVASWLARTAALGRPPDHDLRTLRRILEVNPSAVREAAGKWLEPSRIFVVMAGAGVEPGLRG